MIRRAFNRQSGHPSDETRNLNRQSDVETRKAAINLLLSVRLRNFQVSIGCKWRCSDKPVRNADSGMWEQRLNDRHAVSTINLYVRYRNHSYIRKSKSFYGGVGQ